ncbi:type VI secretion system lipoprotein TssJ [Paraburkholderia sp. D15]|uniref:type VI secretion system lipoprotein TssJ n=1 Tax=Paraburkholderia sp. D15 TaxID=2880218 RepID=UPI00247A3E5E|nr:type VI secretion system lipoprotein TssJ [Paraburkholderia sp. D15]WGS49453.1 type VI secretion system lipoprotein TssJ [Paraburkholderia sp. D15]
MSAALLILLTLSVLMMGCATPQQTSAAPFTVSLDVSPAVNPDGHGRPAPILVGLYDLKSSAAFSASGFAPLQDRAKATLGDDLVALDQMILRPGEQRTIERLGNSQTRSLGIVAGYRELNQSVWRAVVAVPAGDDPGFFSFWPFEPQPLVVHATIGDSGIVVRILNRDAR